MTCNPGRIYFNSSMTIFLVSPSSTAEILTFPPVLQPNLFASFVMNTTIPAPQRTIFFSLTDMTFPTHLNINAGYMNNIRIGYVESVELRN